MRRMKFTAMALSSLLVMGVLGGCGNPVEGKRKEAYAELSQMESGGWQDPIRAQLNQAPDEAAIESVMGQARERDEEFKTAQKEIDRKKREDKVKYGAHNDAHLAEMKPLIGKTLTLKERTLGSDAPEGISFMLTPDSPGAMQGRITNVTNAGPIESSLKRWRLRDDGYADKAVNFTYSADKAPGKDPEKDVVSYFDVLKFNSDGTVEIWSTGQDLSGIWSVS